MSDEQRYLIYLINCALKSQSAKYPDFDMDWNAFARYVKKQQFEQILYPLFKDQKPKISPKIWHYLHQRYGHALVRDANQDADLEVICNTLTAADVPHIPLKGSVIKKYYPLPYLRFSGDFDILVKECDMQEAKDALLKIGYNEEDALPGIHDVLNRGKTSIELHRQLVQNDNVSFEFCSEVWEYSKPEKGLTYVMSNEFFYIYMLVHLRKHLLLSGGAGIKLILDIYIMRKYMNIDISLLDDYCRRASMENFNLCVVKLSQKWFEGVECTDENVLKTEEIILNSGAYSDYDMYLKMVMSKGGSKGKFKKFMSYLFPSAKVLKGKYTVLEKYPYLLPFMWIVRVFTTKRKKAADAFSSFKSFETKDSLKLNQYMNDMWK